MDLYYKKYKVKPKNAVSDKKNCLKCRKLRKMKKYVTELQAWNAQDLGDIPIMVKSAGFNPTKIKVVAQLADKTERFFPIMERTQQMDIR